MAQESSKTNGVGKPDDEVVEHAMHMQFTVSKGRWNSIDVLLKVW
eukprot:CAMPEP_0113707444 /NCGR_PEP_ID=MMETSP0038_2-20120614/28402_1 /TAXON_ID=2898 /ORGANISM="Cryptomonas paramecium" /LENGTH=44 /DNA_ID=CAMNT_0000632985 /DNA_START=34 /DNA_END=165 /DNA_ORIENTATION=- /assembly_acc=CAM_ASM_000170